MRNVLKITVAAAALAGAAMLWGAPAQAQGFAIGVGPQGGINFSISSGGYCDEYGCPDQFWDYPIYYCPVFYRGGWYRGPVYYRNEDGDVQFWVRGAWHHDQWDGPRPDWACTDRFGPPLGFEFYDSRGFHMRDEWRRWHHDYDHGPAFFPGGPVWAPGGIPPPFPHGWHPGIGFTPGGPPHWGPGGPGGGNLGGGGPGAPGGGGGFHPIGPLHPINPIPPINPPSGSGGGGFHPIGPLHPINPINPPSGSGGSGGSGGIHPLPFHPLPHLPIIPPSGSSGSGGGSGFHPLPLHPFHPINPINPPSGSGGSSGGGSLGGVGGLRGFGSSVGGGGNKFTPMIHHNGPIHPTCIPRKGHPCK